MFKLRSIAPPPIRKPRISLDDGHCHPVILRIRNLTISSGPFIWNRITVSCRDEGIPEKFYPSDGTLWFLVTAGLFGKMQLNLEGGTNCPKSRVRLFSVSVEMIYGAPIHFISSHFESRRSDKDLLRTRMSASNAYNIPMVSQRRVYYLRRPVYLKGQLESVSTSINLIWCSGETFKNK